MGKRGEEREEERDGQEARERERDGHLSSEHEPRWRNDERYLERLIDAP
jgi:hypothetical protein